MKFSAVFVLALTSVMASPIADTSDIDARAGSDLEARAKCYHGGPHCAWTNGGTCEGYCKELGKKFTFMESCGLGTKRCCCTK